MPTDDKLVSLFEIMISGFGSMNSRVNNIENNVHALISEKVQSERRIKLLEYKSIDQEVQSRRNNLIFRGWVVTMTAFPLSRTFYPTSSICKMLQSSEPTD